MTIGRPQSWNKCTVANLPTLVPKRRERLFLVTDGASFGDLATGGGSFSYLLWHTGANWQALGTPVDLFGDDLSDAAAVLLTDASANQITSER